ncbi:MAG: nucleotidyltransferase domain-containing protein [Oscillospiraceae bacterium]|nr:nucleotidyltransferase domain-containing protein [Oscillospiraceae bacterium]
MSGKNITSEVWKQLNIIKEGVLATVPDTEAIYLFGSYAYGTPHKDSDLDIYVVVPDSVRKNPLDVGVDIRKYLRGKGLIMPMDLMVGKSSIFNRRKEGHTLQRTIAKEGIVFYGQQ